MEILHESMIKKLSFPDYAVEKMDFSPENKTLHIFMEGAWLNIDEGIKFGRGVISFCTWEAISINGFNPVTEKWMSVEWDSLTEPLKDLCEIVFFDSTVLLSGFGKQCGQWVEWKIMNPKMYAKFEKIIRQRNSGHSSVKSVTGSISALRKHK